MAWWYPRRMGGRGSQRCCAPSWAVTATRVVQTLTCPRTLSQPNLLLDYQAMATQLLRLDGCKSVPFTDEEKEDHYLPGGPLIKVGNGATTVVMDAMELVITTRHPLPSTDEWADSQGSFGALAAKGTPAPRWHPRPKVILGSSTTAVTCPTRCP